MPPIDTNWEDYIGVVIGNFTYFVFNLPLDFCLVGWGTQFYAGPISNVLMKVEVPIWNNQACQDVYSVNKIYDTVMCAGSLTGGKDACQVNSF